MHSALRFLCGSLVYGFDFRCATRFLISCQDHFTLGFPLSSACGVIDRVNWA